MLTVPSLVIKSVQTELFSFLWKNKKGKIKRRVIYQPLAEGGLNFVNFFAVVKSLRLAWISRLLSSTTDSWKTIPNYYFNTYGGLKFLLKCNYNSASINNDLPTFYWELLQYFQEFKDRTNTFSYGEFLLWNNETITIDKKTPFWKSCFKKNILSVQDILNADGNFLTFQEFQDNLSCCLCCVVHCVISRLDTSRPELTCSQIKSCTKGNEHPASGVGCPRHVGET